MNSPLGGKKEKPTESTKGKEGREGAGAGPEERAGGGRGGARGAGPGAGPEGGAS